MLEHTGERAKADDGGRARRARARWHGHGDGPRSMLIPVGVLTVLATIGGFVEIPGVDTVFANWIDPVARAARRPERAAGLRHEPHRRHRGRSRRRVAWIAFKAGREIVGRPARAQVFAHKFYFDELYDALFSRPPS